LQRRIVYDRFVPNPEGLPDTAIDSD
jgi:hypothetical protein